VDLPTTVQLLGKKTVGLAGEDFQGGTATTSQLSSLRNFRVVAPAKTPRKVAGKIIAALSARHYARRSEDLCQVWQMNSLVDDYGYPPEQVRGLSYDAALDLINAGRKKAGKQPYWRGQEAGGADATR
jgi:hypothetical protein